jgi:hypothetical protein
VAAVDQLTAIGGRRGSPDRRSPVGRLASTLARSEMKTLLLASTALAVASAVNLSPAMANRFGPFDTRLTNDSDRLGQNGVNAATTTVDGRHYEWQYH